MATKCKWSWVVLYEAALFETDTFQLPARIAIATEELQARLRQLKRRADELERQNLLYALNNLRIVGRGAGLRHENYGCA